MENSLSLSVEKPETLVTTKELANVLGITTRTVQMTVERLGLTNVLSQVKIRGQNSFAFTEEQATLIKKEIQKHHNLANRQIDSVSTEYEENQIVANAVAILQRRSIELQKQIEAQKVQIEELTPDAESWRKFAESDGSFSATNVAKLLKISRDDVLEFLSLRHYIMRERHENPNKKGRYQATALGIERGYVVNYLYTNDKISQVQFHITPKGMQKIEKAFNFGKLSPEQEERVNALCKEAEKNMKSSSMGKAE